MHRFFAPVTVVTVLALTVAACGGTDDGRSAMTGDTGLDVCSLVSDDTVEKLQATSVDEQPSPSEVLMAGAELFVECRITIGVDVGFAVRAAPGGPDLRALVDDAEPLEGVGDEAYVGDNTYDGVRIAARVGDQELIVNSNASTGRSGDGVGRDDMIALATEVAAALGDTKPAAAHLPTACPPASDPTVEQTIGATLVARGTVTDNGSVTCDYASDSRALDLAAEVPTGYSAVATGDGAGLDVDGDRAEFDPRAGIVVRVGDTCLLRAGSSPLAWTLADPRPESERRDEAVELARFVKTSIGCP